MPPHPNLPPQGGKEFIYRTLVAPIPTFPHREKEFICCTLAAPIPTFPHRGEGVYISHSGCPHPNLPSQGGKEFICCTLAAPIPTFPRRGGRRLYIALWLTPSQPSPTGRRSLYVALWLPPSQPSPTGGRSLYIALWLPLPLTLLHEGGVNPFFMLVPSPRGGRIGWGNLYSLANKLSFRISFKTIKNRKLTT